MGFCDADWATNLTNKRPTAELVFLLQGAALMWNSKKQPTVALSTTNAHKFVPKICV